MRNIFFLGLCLLGSLLAAGTKELRNPFAPPHVEKKNKAKRGLLLEGIVACGSKQHALLSNGTDREAVPHGGHFGGYQVKEIGKNFVVVSNDTHTKKLLME